MELSFADRRQFRRAMTDEPGHDAEEGHDFEYPESSRFRDLRPWVGRNVVLFFGVALVATYAALASHHLVPRPLDLQQVEKLFDKNEGKCGGKLNIQDLAEYHLITASMNKPDDPASRKLHGDGDAIKVGMKSRAYLGNSCADGDFKQSEYMKVNWMGKRLSFTVDLSEVGCGCNAALYMVSMSYSYEAGGCSDYYCDAVSVCDMQCAEIDLMEANNRAFHTTLHDGQHPWDPKVGCGGAGYTAAGEAWTGPRDWSKEQYGPGADCIDTRKPFEASFDFEVHEDEWKLKSLNVFLTQDGCQIHASTQRFGNMFDILTHRLNEGMTLVISYWSDPGMLWLDGARKDEPFCKAEDEKDGHRQCGESVTLKAFKVKDLPRPYAWDREALESNATVWLN